jgi:hypothetical protein
MLIEPEVLLARLLDGLLAHRISYRRLACDSLLLYVDCEPGDDNGVTIWFEPIWHLYGPDGALLGSMQVAAAADCQKAMAAVADGPMATILGKSVAGVTIDPISFDLTVAVEGGYGIRTFVADATTEESWHIRENSTRIRLQGSPRGLIVQPPTAEA